jgi:WD40 repeat protein
MADASALRVQQPLQFDLFLCHNSRDKDLVEQISERLLEECHVRCWLDVWSIPAASDWEAEIERALASCRACAVFVGGNGWGPYHRIESRRALELHNTRPEYAVIPVLLPGGRLEDLAGFEHLHFVDMREGTDSTDAYSLITSAFSQTAPFELGRARLGPYTIRRDARRWNARGSGRRNDDVLYRGKQLVEAQQVVRQFPGQMDALALQFLSASEQRMVVRRRLWTASLLVLAVVFAAAALWAEWNRREARHQLAFVHREQARQHLVEGNASAGFAHAVRSVDLDANVPDARYVLGIASRLLASRQHVLVGHLARLSSVDVSVARDRLVSAGEDGRAHLWSLRDGKLIATLATARVPISVAVFSPDGQRIALGGHDGSVALHDSMTGTLHWRKMLFNQERGADLVGAMKWHPDGRRLIVGTYSGRVLTFASGEGEQTDLFQSGTAVLQLDVSPDGRWAGVPTDRGGQLVPLAGGPAVPLGSGSASVVRFFPGSEEVLVGESEGWLSAYDARTGLRALRYSGHDASATVVDVDVSHDGTWLASGGSDGRVIVWKRGRPKPSRVFNEAHNYISKVRFDPSGKYLFSGAWDAHVRVHSLDSMKTVALLAAELGGVRALAVIDSERVLAGGTRGHVAVWNWPVAARAAPRFLGHHLEINEALFVQHGSKVITSSDDGTVRSWELKTGHSTLLLELEHAARPLAVSTDGSMLAVGSEDGVRLVPLGGTGEVVRLSGCAEPKVLRFVSRGAVLLAGCGSDSLVRWELTSPTREPRRVQGITGRIMTIAHEEATGRVAIGMDDGLVLVSVGAELSEFTLRMGPIRTIRKLMFAPGALVGCEIANNCFIWKDTAPKKPIMLSGHGGYIEDIDVQGEMLATAGDDHTARLWSIASGEPLATLEGHGATVYSVRFVPGTGAVVTVGADGAARLWSIKTGDQLASLHTGGLPRFVTASEDVATVLVGSDSEEAFWAWDVSAELRGADELARWGAPRARETLVEDRLVARPLVTLPLSGQRP